MKHSVIQTFVLYALQLFVRISGSKIYKCREKPPCFSTPEHFSLKKEVGEFIELSCRIIGYKDKDVVIWEKNGETISVNSVFFSVDERFRLIYENKSSHSVWTFVINFAKNSDSGFYACKVPSISGQLYYDVQVRDSGPKVKYSHLRKVKIRAPDFIKEFQKFNITCSITTPKSSTQFISVDWFRWGEQLSTSQQNAVTLMKQISSISKDTVTSEAVLSFQRAIVDLNGDYTCKAYTPTNRGSETVVDKAVYTLKVRQSRDSYMARYFSNGLTITASPKYVWEGGHHVSRNTNDFLERQKDITLNDDTAYRKSRTGKTQRQQRDDLNVPSEASNHCLLSAYLVLLSISASVVHISIGQLMVT